MKESAPFPLMNEDTAARPSPSTLGEPGTTGVALVATGPRPRGTGRGDSGGLRVQVLLAVGGLYPSGGVMGKKERIATVIEALGANPDNVEHLVEEVDRFFESLNAEIEGWKFVMEEFEDGTRLLARFQIMLRK